MDFSPLSFSYEDPELRLAGDIISWLKQYPALADISSYIGKLPEDKLQQVVNCTASSLCAELFDQKFEYFTKAAFGSFVQDLSESDQLANLSLFQEYNPLSVVRNIQKGRVLQTPSTLPLDLSQWSKQYLETIDSLLSFCANAEAMDLQFLLREVKKNARDFAEIDVMEQQVATACQHMQERFIANRPPSTADLETERKLWFLFTFIPVQFAQEQLGAEDSTDKRDMLINLHTALTLMQSLKGQYSAPPEAPDEFLNFTALRYVREDIRPEILVTFNVHHERKFRQTKEVKAINQLLHYFQDVWTIDRIMQEQVSPNLLAAVDMYKGEDLELFVTTLYSFIRRSVIFDPILPPYFIDFLLLEAGKLDNPNIVTEYAQDLAEDLEHNEMTEVFVHFFRELYVITHTFKESNV